jgi:rhamnosyltransferase subunit B
LLPSPQGVLGLIPNWFAPPQTDWPARVELTGFPLFDEAEFRTLDPELEDFLRQEDPRDIHAWLDLGK